MTGGPNRRFPRTARAMPEARAPIELEKMTIEREKIRHRRPNDLMFDPGQAPVTRRSLLTDDIIDDQVHGGEALQGEDLRGDIHDADAYADDGYDDADGYDTADQDWTDEGQEVLEQPVWDDDAEDDWVLTGDDEPGADGFDALHPEDDEGGVVWEDDALLEPGPRSSNPRSPEPPSRKPRSYAPRSPQDGDDEVTFGAQENDFGFAPEVELAGRRDVRPRPPRPAPAYRERAPRQPTRRQPQSSQDLSSHHQLSHRQPNQLRGRSHRTAWSEDVIEPPIETGPGGGRSFDARPRSAGRFSEDAAAEAGRFSRTRAILGTSVGGADEQVLQQPRHAASPRRRQAHAAPAAAAPLMKMPKRDRYGAIRAGGGWGKRVIAVLVLALLAGGAWYGYQTVGADGVRPMIDRLMAILPLPEQPRTAADTSFGGQESADRPAAGATVSPDQALADLERRIQQRNADLAAAGQTPPAAEPAPGAAEGPPIPKFKPLPNDTRSLTAEPSSELAGEVAGQAEAARNQAEPREEDVGALTVFERLWQYINPG